MVEQFTVQEFENALPDDVINQGLQSGEFGYEIPLPHGRIIIRSSIGPNGVSAGTGKDSIRLWLEIRMSDGKYKPLKKLDDYTNRVPGWQKHMNDKIQTLWDKGLLFTADCPVCPDCSNGWPAISQSQKNPNRAFVSCRDHNYFKWIDEIANRGVESSNAPPVSDHNAQICISYLKLIDNPDDTNAFKIVYNIASKDFVNPWKSKDGYGKPSPTRFLEMQMIEWCNGSYDYLQDNLHKLPTRWQSGVWDLVDFMDKLEIQCCKLGAFGGLQFITKECLTNWTKLNYGHVKLGQDTWGLMEMSKDKSVKVFLDSIRENIVLKT